MTIPDLIDIEQVVASVHLPMPPSDRASFVWCRHAKQRLPTIIRRQWNEAARIALKRAALRPFRGRVTIEIRAGKSPRPRDLDSLVRPVIDLLIWGVAIEGDNPHIVREVRLLWDPHLGPETIQVTVRSLLL